MRLDKFTLRGQEAIQVGIEVAERNQHQQVEPEHLLFAMLEQPEGIVCPVLNKLGANVQILLTDIQLAVARFPRVQGGQQYFSPLLSQVFTASQKQADGMKDEFVSTEHLLLAIVDDKDGEAGKILRQHGVKKDDLLKVIEQMRGGSRITDQNAEQNYQALSKYTRDLTDLARQGKLDPVIGRDDEIRRIIRVLLRRSRNSSVIIGEPGVGKTSIVEGLALKIVSGDVPEALRNHRLVALNFNAMIAGAKFRGEVEERLNAILHEIENAASQIVLYIEELRALIGGTTDLPFDVWYRLKSALGQGHLRCIGVSNINEYQKYIEGDSAKRHYFQPVVIAQPTVENTITILRALKDQYEIHHGVRIKDSALVAAVVLSNNNIKDRFLPTKAIDVMDEAAAHLRINLDSLPVEIERLEHEITQLELERQALQYETEAAPRARLREVEQHINNLRGQYSGGRDKWRNHKDALDVVRATQVEIEQLAIQHEHYSRAGDLSALAELQYRRLPELEQRLDMAQGNLNELQRDGILIKQEVDEECVAAIVADWIGIPVPELDWSGLDRIKRS
jgi:ATP-dependent Clp protease ATP-binding subunit ClpB